MMYTYCVVNITKRSLVYLTSVSHIAELTDLSIESILQLINGNYNTLSNVYGVWSVVCASPKCKTYVSQRLFNTIRDYTLTEQDIENVIKDMHNHVSKFGKLPYQDDKFIVRTIKNVKPRPHLTQELPQEQLCVTQTEINTPTTLQKENENVISVNEPTVTRYSERVKRNKLIKIHKSPETLVRKRYMMRKQLPRPRMSKKSLDIVRIIEQIKEKEKQEVEDKYHKLLQTLKKY